MSADQEVDRISQAKSDIKAAIERKGVTVGDGRIDTYAQKIDQITGGGGYPEPTGTIEITENGEGIDVKDYASANVNVSGGGGGAPANSEYRKVHTSGGDIAANTIVGWANGIHINSVSPRKIVNFSDYAMEEPISYVVKASATEAIVISQEQDMGGGGAIKATVVTTDSQGRLVKSYATVELVASASKPWQLAGAFTLPNGDMIMAYSVGENWTVTGAYVVKLTVSNHVPSIGTSYTLNTTTTGISDSFFCKNVGRGSNGFAIATYSGVWYATLDDNTGTVALEASTALTQVSDISQTQRTSLGTVIRRINKTTLDVFSPDADASLGTITLPDSLTKSDITISDVNFYYDEASDMDKFCFYVSGCWHTGQGYDYGTWSLRLVRVTYTMFGELGNVSVSDVFEYFPPEGSIVTFANADKHEHLSRTIAIFPMDGDEVIVVYITELSDGQSNPVGVRAIDITGTDSATPIVRDDVKIADCGNFKSYGYSFASLGEIAVFFSGTGKAITVGTFPRVRAYQARDIIAGITDADGCADGGQIYVPFGN